MFLSNLFTLKLGNIRINHKINFLNQEKNEEEDDIIYVKCVGCGTARPLWISDINKNGEIEPSKCICGGKYKVMGFDNYTLMKNNQ